MSEHDHFSLTTEEAVYSFLCNGDSEIVQRGKKALFVLLGSVKEHVEVFCEPWPSVKGERVRADDQELNAVGL